SAFFLFTHTTTSAIYTLSLHDALPISTEEGHSTDVVGSLKNVFPWFILGFLAMALLNSVGFIPGVVSVIFKDASKFLMIMALGRSEEHTSELQSRFDLVCRLLLEKKKE